MNRRTAAVVAGLWFLSVGLSILLAWRVSAGVQQRRGVTTEQIGDKTEPLPHGWKGERSAEKPAILERENQALAEEVSKLREELSQAKEQARRAATGQRPSAEEAAVPTDYGEAASIYWEDVDALKYHNVGGAEDWMVELLIQTAVDMASRGEVGARFLVNKAFDESLAKEERLVALWALRFVPRRAAFDTIMAFQGSELLKATGKGEEWSFPAIAYHVSRLPTEDLFMHIPEIHEHLMEDASDNDLGYHALKVAAALAFKHDDTFCVSLLESVPEHDLDDVVRFASIFHTDQARELLGRFLAAPPSEEIGDMAREAVLNW